jgi:hypothetical protein
MRSLAALLALAASSALTPAVAQHTGASPERLGTVAFTVECNEAAQKEFRRAMALYHSFAWPAAAASFDAVLQADASCGMAHWGRAMTMLDNPFVWPANLSPKKLDDLVATLDAARSAGLKSQREKDYVDAVGAFVRDRDKLDHRTRLRSFEEAMERLAARYPDDEEASILWALVTSASFDPADKAYANQLKAARILEPIFEKRPDHPGVAHYLIHSYDYPPLAKHGVEAARKYASIAPDAPHAQHMPSHIFTRLGHWRDSIAANRASAQSASEATFDGHHASDYMVYAHLQLAQDGAAQEAMERSRSRRAVDNFAAAYAYAAMPARLALERDQWRAAAELPLDPPADAYPWKKYPQAEAVNAFARGIGAARTGDVDAAGAVLRRLLALRDAAREAKIAYWSEQIETQADVVGSLALCAEGKSSDCIEALRRVAAREDATEKHVVTPGPILPARELLADMLLAVEKPREALDEYEAVLEKEPNRYRAQAGAMLAADRAGEREKARGFAAELAKQGADADAERASLTHARRLIAAQ